MKKTYTLLLLVISIFSLNAQDKNPIEYPFAAPGTEVTRGVFGSDDRREVKDAEGFQEFVRATAAMIYKKNVYNDEFYAWSLKDLLKQQFGVDRFHPNVKFLDQPTVADCSGFLIAPDILVTAGHCIRSQEDAENVVWVFDYTSESDFIDGNRLDFKKSNVYEVESVISTVLDNTSKTDYAILKLKRQSERAPYRFRTSGEVLEQGPIYTIGSPTGLPLKFSTNAIVTDNSPKQWFKSDIDAFPGNSGGPVFDQNGFLEGILVRGAVTLSGGRYTGDYKYDEECDCIKTVQWDTANYTAGCQAQKITQLPPDALVMAIYSNIEYAIKNNLKQRFDSWSIYSWIFNYPYTMENGRFENLAITNNNVDALTSVLNFTSEDITDNYSRELIDLAISNNNLEALKALLEKGLLADAGLNANKTALQNAVENNKSAVVETLIYYGADLKVTTNTGENLLHIAAKRGNTSLAELFVQNGIDAGVKNNEGQYPEKIAKKAGFKDLSKYLKKARKGRL